MWLISNQLNMVKLTACSMIILCYIRFHLANRPSLKSLVPTWWSQWTSWKSPCAWELWAASRSWVTGSWGPNKKPGLSVLQPQEINSANNLAELEIRFFPCWSSRWEYSLADTLIIPLWDPKQRTQLSCAQTSDPWKLWENNRSSLQSFVICYTTMGNEYNN